MRDADSTTRVQQVAVLTCLLRPASDVVLFVCFGFWFVSLLGSACFCLMGMEVVDEK